MSATWRVLETGGAETGVSYGLGAIVRLIKAMAGRIRAAHQSRRLRQLDHLDNHLLRDIGVRPGDLQREATDLRGIADRLMLVSDRPRHL